MPKKKSIALYRKNLFKLKNADVKMKQWLYSQSEFDQRNMLTEQSVYAQDASLVERTIKEYDDNGFLLREKYFIEDNELSEEKSYERDEQGLLLRELKHYIDGSYDTTTYQYDSQHRIVDKIISNDEGEVEQKLINEYRGDYLVKTQVFDGDGKMLWADEFKFDEDGNSVEHKWIDNEKGSNSYMVSSYNSSGQKKEETSYDEDGEIVKQTFYEENEHGKLLTITEESSEKNVVIRFVYDEHGNAISQEEIDDQGRQLVLVKREYDQDNNLVRSEVFIDGLGKSISQHYELVVEYQFYKD